MLWINAGAAVALLPVLIIGMAVGVGWVEAFGEGWAVGLMLALLVAAVIWARRQGRQVLPAACAPSVRRALGALDWLWSVQLLMVGICGAAAQWWIARVLSSTADRTVLLPWAANALLAAGLALVLAGWFLGPRLLYIRRVLRHDVVVQRRRIQTGALIIWSCFEAAGLLGAVVACGTLSLLPFDLLGGGAIASLLAHRLLWYERLVDLMTHPPLVKSA